MTPDSKAVVARLEEAAGNVRSGGWVESAATCLEAADLIETLTAPVDGLETTAKERNRWRDLLTRDPDSISRMMALPREQSVKLLDDIDRLHAQLAAERAKVKAEEERWVRTLASRFIAEDELAAERVRAERMAEAGRPFLRDVPDNAEDHDTVGMTVTFAELRALRAALTEKPT